MEIFKYLLVILIITSIILILIYFNKQIQQLLFENSIEKFVSGDRVGLKWLYLGNEEPDGDKISNEKLYILLNYKWVSPIIISVDELDSANITNILSNNSYIDIDGRYFKPYNSSTGDKDVGLMWKNLGSLTESHVKKYYTEIKNNKIEKALEDKMKNKTFEVIDGEDIYTFTKSEFDSIKENSVLTYDTYIIVGNNKDIFQPYYEHKIVETKSIFSDINIDKVLRRGFDNTYLRSTPVKTLNSKTDEYFNTEIYNNKGVSNDELHFSTESKIYRQSNDDSYKSILEPIEDNYLPYTNIQYEDDPNYMSEKAINEYAIIDIYKNILDRHPKQKELMVNLQEFYEKNSDEEKLKLKLYNSTEYKIIVKMQSNYTDPTLISTISEKNIIEYLLKIYEDFFNKLPHDKMKIPLKQCYIHLQFNDYLFRAMLMHDNYVNFEKAVLREYIINDEKLLEIFDKNFVLYELRLIANELKKREVLKRIALKTPIALTTNASKNSAESSNSENTNLNSDKHISDIMKNSEPVFNINIIMQDKNMSSPYKGSAEEKESFNPLNALGFSTSNLEFNPLDISNQIGNNPNNRIYDPITYKQHYRGPMEYRPNVCSYGTKQVVNPLYLNSPGTDLKEAIEHTQVGSIMPKFVYREYEDIKK
jgi:hypothetical protein